MKRIELLAPAKDYASAVAAVDYGADAIYIGGVRYGARHAAGNSAEDIARVVEYAHQYGVRVHATLNTLLWDDELWDVERHAHELIDVGVDALIVQDMALRRMNLPVELHASTQVHTLNPAQAQFLEKCGFARVILERAMTLDQIRTVCAATQAEVECFVHGALCVGYSGRCFLSRSMSHRSGNRGECSQPCRLTWDLTDGQGVRHLVGRHLLSLRDLNLASRVGDLMDAGVVSFKIEGRLKDVNYIKNVVAYYRRAVDQAIAVRDGFVRSSVGESAPDFTPDPAKSFTRGDSEYYLNGRTPGVASFDTPKSVGEYVGRVVEVGGDFFMLDRDSNLAPGDGLCFGVLGTNVHAADMRRVRPDRLEGIVVGTDIYRNYDHRFNLQLDRSRTRRVIPAKAVFSASAERIAVRFFDCEGVEAEVVREGAFEQASDASKMATTIITQLRKSGDTIFDVREVEGVDGCYFVPASVLASMRRDGLDMLRQNRVQSPLEHKILPENMAARCPSEHLTAQDNVTNSRAEQFYRDHGVWTVERGLDLEPSTTGRWVVRTAYCLRGEIGQCLKKRPKITDDLYVEHGAFRYKLCFDCERCEMSLEDVTEKR